MLWANLLADSEQRLQGKLLLGLTIVLLPCIKGIAYMVKPASPL